jgi:hypothetical protein
MPAPVTVNLLPKDPFLHSPIGKFLQWSMSIGRYLVVFTELIVILSFLSRFKLDRDLTDLNEEIEVQKQTILSYADTEDRFNSVKTKLDLIQRVQENQTILPALNFLEKSLPIDVKLNQINFSAQGWNINGSALSAQSLRVTAVRVLAANPDALVSLSEIKLNSRSGTIDFIMSIKYPTTVKSKSTAPSASQTKPEI